jgi:hypothetical protein
MILTKKINIKNQNQVIIFNIQIRVTIKANIIMIKNMILINIKFKKTF